MALHYPNEAARQAVAGTLDWVPFIAVPRALLVAFMSLFSIMEAGPHGVFFPALPWPAAVAGFVACWWVALESLATARRSIRLAQKVRSAEAVSPDALSSSRRERYRWGVFFEFLALVAAVAGPFMLFDDGASRARVALLIFWLVFGLGVRLCRTRLLVATGILPP